MMPYRSNLYFSCRVVLQQLLREVRLQNRMQGLSGSETKAKACMSATADDGYRALGTLVALGRFTDKLLLFAKAIRKDEWLAKRAPRHWPWRNAVYI